MIQMPVLRSASIPGKCSVCGLLFHLVPSTGVPRRHAFVGSFSACVGSFLLPEGVLCNEVLVKNLDEGMCCSPTSPSTSESSAAESVDSFTIHLPSLNGFPVLFATRLLLYFKLASEIRFLTLIFLVPLANLLKGGRRINLSSRILAQLVAFDEGAPDSSTVVNPRSLL